MSVKNDCGNEVHKFLWFDTETTGTDPIKHDIIQIAGQIVVGGIVMDSFDYRCQPFDWDTIEEKALEKNGITREEIATFPEPDIIYGKLKRMFRKYINPYDKADKFIAGGQNVRFDIDMTHHFFKKNKDDFFFSFVRAGVFDTLHMATMLEVKERKRIFKKGYKLEQLCEELGVPLENAHDALADITATRQVANILWKRLVMGE